MELNHLSIVMKKEFNNRFYLVLIFSTLFIFCSSLAFSQADRWQQEVKYEMDIDVDAKKNQYKGYQNLLYTNHSPDTLTKVFYHLYFNAFQPGSMMDVRSRSLPDPDKRITDKISSLQKDEVGYIKVKSLSINGTAVTFEEVGTILEVELSEPLLPGSKTVFEMTWDAQVPLQTRRSGRDNKEGIRFSMAQWYPKMCEYDYQGWHANPYIGREFYSVWGDFDVTIHIDKDYLIGATGLLENAMEIGYGYQPTDISQPKIKSDKTSWHFIAENVGDFVWAADPDYKHFYYRAYDGTIMHFVYQANDKTVENWSQLPKILNEALKFMNKRYGQYPYPVYSFIQGGDGGMEYPMATLITGERTLSSLVGVSVHEWMHSWYQCILGSNESLYAWMDEGFTSYATAEVMNHLKAEKLIPGTAVDNPMEKDYIGFSHFAKTDYEEPLSIHSDHFGSNYAYGVGAYTKGAIFLNQIEYILGEEVFSKALLRYYNTWKFKHPNPNDFIRVMEKESGLELDWYIEYFVNTTKTIDYGINSVKKINRKQVLISLEKFGKMPMPVDLLITKKDGSKHYYTIPLRIMRGAKTSEGENKVKYQVLEDWPWTNAEYSLTLDIKYKNIAKIEIDPEYGMIDVNIENNDWTRAKMQMKD